MPVFGPEETNARAAFREVCAALEKLEQAPPTETCRQVKERVLGGDEESVPVAILGRAKVFYDEPRGFAETLAAGGTIGAAWQRYFELDSEGPTWSAVGGDIGRKRATFWSILGDPTLRLPPPR